MKTKIEPMGFQQAADSLPVFAVGLVVRVWYMGLLGPTETLDPKHRVTSCRIEGVRLKPQGYEEWNEEKQELAIVTEYPKGWEYLAVAPDGSEDGWIAEADLLAKGYRPAPSIYDDQLTALKAWAGAWLVPEADRISACLAALKLTQEIIAKRGGI